MRVQSCRHLRAKNPPVTLWKRAVTNGAQFVEHRNRLCFFFFQGLRQQGNVFAFLDALVVELVSLTRKINVHSELQVKQTYSAAINA